MNLKVLLFASYADALGSDAVALNLGEGATVRDMLGTLRSLPGAASLPPSPLVAVNEHYAGADQVLRAGDEVAVIPPVAGG
jgi:molybdopterin converting factor subunit 1